MCPLVSVAFGQKGFGGTAVEGEFDSAVDAIITTHP
jgi:hypothetical protein